MIAGIIVSSVIFLLSFLITFMTNDEDLRYTTINVCIMSLSVFVLCSLFYYFDWLR